MLKEDFLYISVTIIILTVVAVSGAFLLYSRTNQLLPSPIPSWSSQPVACTMEAKLCPDGSAVGRVGPNCEFAPCPIYSPLPRSECKYDSDCPIGYLCIQSCGPPVVREDDLPPPYYCESKEIAEKPRICPICLASNTEISTPVGAVNVKDIKVGTVVWSLDKNGKKIESVVVEVSGVPVPANHQMIHLVLSDKREVWVSPGHPTVDGISVSELRAGNFYDGSTIKLAEAVPYLDNATYDILPDSDTGYYWANNILFGSTLADSQGWDTAQKKEIIVGPASQPNPEGSADPTAITNLEELEIFTQNIVGQDPNIKKIRLASGSTELDYRYEGKFLGFIPIKSVLKVSVGSDSRVKVKYPWYIIFIKKSVELKFNDAELDLSKFQFLELQSELQKQAWSLQLLSNIMKAKRL